METEPVHPSPHPACAAILTLQEGRDVAIFLTIKGLALYLGHPAARLSFTTSGSCRAPTSCDRALSEGGFGDSACFGADKVHSALGSMFAPPDVGFCMQSQMLLPALQNARVLALTTTLTC